MLVRVARGKVQLMHDWTQDRIGMAYIPPAPPQCSSADVIQKMMLTPPPPRCSDDVVTRTLRQLWSWL